MAVDWREGDPYVSFAFLVEIDGATVGGFTDVTGLQVEIETHDYREGGVNEYMHKLAGPARYPSNLVLKHGLMDADVLWQWQRQVVQGDVERKNVGVVLQLPSGKAVWQWEIEQAYPVKWSGPELKASQAEVAVETLELAHRGFRAEPV
jgi:phage tail-like protein